MKVRLDKYLANLGIGSRREIAKMVKQGFISVNGELAIKSDMKITENDKIEVLGDIIPVVENITVLLHKPAGYVSSDVDEGDYKSYKHLLKDCIFSKLLKVAGRLDVDTEGLLVLSSNGKLIHNLISPKKGKEKIYYVEVENNLSDADIKKLQEGVNIGDYITLPSKILILPSDKQKIKEFGDFKDKTLNQIPNSLLKGKQAILLKITEGKFHQIKRMMESVGNKVVYLKRLKMGNYELEDLEKEQWKIVGKG